MKLYLVHVGFYDTELFDGVYESHANFFVVASNFEEARVKAKQHPDYKRKKMHVDGLQEISAVEGYRVSLEADPQFAGRDVIIGSRHRELAPKAPGTPVS